MSSFHKLSNGRFTTHISRAGTGYAACGDIALTRWSGDRIEDRDAQVLYIRDLDSGALWSIGRQPAGAGAERYRTRLSPERVEIRRSDDGVDTVMELCVTAADPVELRRYTITNRSDRARRLDVTGYAELVLAPPAAHASHPVFSKLFVQTAWDAERAALIALRRPRGADDAVVGAVSWLAAAGGPPGGIEHETDRLRFIGRGRTAANPRAVTEGGPLSGTVGNVLDPVFALRTTLAIEPGESRTFAIGLAAVTSRVAAEDIVDRYRTPADVDAAFMSLPGAAADPPPDQPPVEEWEGVPAATPRFAPLAPSPSVEAAWPGAGDLMFDNGYGGFTRDGREYVIRVGPEQRPPLPWTHVVANEMFGFIASESGAGFTWAVNSRLNRLTPWFNDPVSDPYGEALYLRDEDAGAFWSPLPGPAASGAPSTVRYGFGTCRYIQTCADLHQRVLMFVPLEDPVKIIRLTLGNHDDERNRRLSVFAYFRLVLGDQSVDQDDPEEPVARTWRDEETGALMASSPARADFAERVAFAAVVASAAGGATMTTDRASFIGRFGSPERPAAVMRETGLDGRSGEQADPCFAWHVPVALAAGGSEACTFLLGEAEDVEAARALVRRYREAGAIDTALNNVKQFWSDTLTVVQVKTPVPAVDVMANGWLLYQVISCRLWARSAFYQSGGAYGFRDQLQDSAALVSVRPDLTRKQILLHAAHQFEEGDVLHWWHPPLSRGMRTRFADDLLWLPFITASYIEAIGEYDILDEAVPFMTAPPLEDGADEVYLQPTVSDRSASLYEHCCRALDRSLTAGAHGLPLMGTGDWNDGMNRVGREGRGESVWLGFFLYQILHRFLPFCRQRGDARRAEAYEAYRTRLANALNDAGWDGGWYRRAYYDDGAPLGSAAGDECRIDALAQAWAVISGAAPRDRGEQALDALETHLISDQDRLIRLLTPPFEHTPHDPGYIKGYVAGVRENGGQYTHAAMWVVQAMAEAGRPDRAAELLEMLSPVSHAATRKDADVYMVEPYVVAADVYGAAPHVGRGGWTWYTGAAGWMYQVTLQCILGVAIEGDYLVMTPRLPHTWPGFELRYRCPDGHTVYEVHVVSGPNRRDETVSAVVLDGRKIDADDDKIRFCCQNDGLLHVVTVTVE
ncbi:MAG: glycosyl transferase [Rhodospirillales bacterium]|nr:glycosyl transferase [Rhodospirillales bacterium]